MRAIVEKAHPFVQKEYTVEDLEKKFKMNPFKLYLLQNIKARGDKATTYQSGNFEDLCRGPHVSDTGKCKHFHITKVTSATFNVSKDEVKPVQRIYGVCFETDEEEEAYQNMLRAAEREHTRIGRELELFMFDDMSPGSAFFLPAGDYIYTTLEALMRKKLLKYDYIQVRTPQLFFKELWETSGHWSKYHENMFVLESEKRVQSLKPMNCPAHCLIFRSKARSYRELPMRMAEFGCCHRNELSGTLHGLSRVRRFTQDDAHIFCAADGIKAELQNCLNLMKEVYAIFGLQHSLMLSTRPKLYIGELSQWEKAEAELKEVLEENGVPFGIDEGGGAFYGPKIDVQLIDSLGRKIQCATVQLDFQLPRRFNLLYQIKGASVKAAPKEKKEKKDKKKEKKEEGAAAEGAAAEASPAEGAASDATPAPASSSSSDAAPAQPAVSLGPSAQGDNFVEAPYDPNFYARPVMIHRAILGSFERFIGIITEHYNRKFPFWLSPRQAMITSISNNDPAQVAYVEEVYNLLKKEHNFQVFWDRSADRLPAKIRAAQMMQYNYILVVGRNEVAERTLAVRERGAPESAQPVTKKIEELVAEWNAMRANYQ